MPFFTATISNLSKSLCGRDGTDKQRYINSWLSTRSACLYSRTLNLLEHGGVYVDEYEDLISNLKKYISDWENKISNMSVSCTSSLNEVSAVLQAWTYLSTVSDIWFTIDNSDQISNNAQEKSLFNTGKQENIFALMKYSGGNNIFRILCI